VRGAGLVKTPEFRVQDVGSTDSSHAVVETREVWVHKAGEFQDVMGYDFGQLNPGNEIQGPAVIWTPITTVVLNPDQVAQVDEYKNLLITRS
jgi:N-methylhydantoinase A